MTAEKCPIPETSVAMPETSVATPETSVAMPERRAVHNKAAGPVPEQIGIIGLGLIGGALAKTIRRIHPQISILACDTNPESLKLASQEHVITRGFSEITDEFARCRYLFLCAPVQKNEEYLEKLAPFLGEGCILSDAGSVKSSIHADIRARGLSHWFIGGHPMAGSEKSGFANATPYLFENAYFIITHDELVHPRLVAEYRSFLESLGCIPIVMSPQKHDFSTAAVSHLPHVLASCLVNLVRQLDDEEESMKSIAAGGFKDITRIASSSPVMWQEICCANREQLLLLIDAFIKSLSQMKEDIAKEAQSQILDFFRQAKDYRDSLPLKKQGPLPSIYEIYCDLIDEAGGIATISTILAANGINIKNIGIIHNREFEEGVLRIEFYEADALEQAIKQLGKHHYVIYERP